MNGILNVTTKIVAYGDGDVSSNPRLKYADWQRNLTGLAVANPQSKGHSIDPGSSSVIFNGTLASTIDGTTAFGIALSSIEASTYRITNTGGTAPGFRTGRSLTLNAVAITFTVNNNATVTVTVPVGPDFTNVQVGDDIFVPHTTTGDTANVLSVLNAGFWRVLGKASSTNLTLVRPAGQDFEAVTQTVTLTANSQFRAFSATGLQAGNSVDISAGFSLTTRKTYTVKTVTDTFIEIVSTTALPSESGILPGASGLQFFSQNKKFVYIEANQECAVRVNGDVGNYQRLSPFDASNSNSVAQYMRTGPTWSLTVVNLSPNTLSLMVVDCE
jgi:hypothetical protein